MVLVTALVLMNAKAVLRLAPKAGLTVFPLSGLLLFCRDFSPNPRQLGKLCSYGFGEIYGGQTL